MYSFSVPRWFAMAGVLLAAACPPLVPTAASSPSCDTAAGRAAYAATLTAPGGTAYWVDRRHPRADDANPGTAALPWRSLARATGPHVLRPGDAVVVRAGRYREAILPQAGGTGPSRRVTYAACPREEVVVTGADVLPGPWHRDGAAWRHAWHLPLPAYGEGPMRRELVVAGGQVLHPVYERAALRPGTFWVEGPDTAPTALFVRLPGDADPRLQTVEAATRHPLFFPLGPNRYAPCGAPDQPAWFRVIGFTFRHAANRAQWGAVCSGPEGGLFEGNTVTWTNGLGIEVRGRHHAFVGNRAVDNGQAGMGGSCTDCRFVDNETSRNNWKGFDPFWEAGGGKWTHTHRSTFLRHTARDNEGPGLWFDHDNTDNAVSFSRFEGNAVAALLLELATTGTLVQHNLLARTRRRAWSGTGLLAQAASGAVILHNTFEENEGMGLWLRLDPQRRAPDGYHRVYNNLFVRNLADPAAQGQEFHLEGADLAHARTNRVDGNRYWPHPDGMERATLYFRPDAAHPADFRGADLGRWRHLTAGAAHDALLDPGLPLALQVTRQAIRVPGLPPAAVTHADVGADAGGWPPR